jgi:hypothetical protein
MKKLEHPKSAEVLVQDDSNSIVKSPNSFFTSEVTRLIISNVRSRVKLGFEHGRINLKTQTFEQLSSATNVVKDYTRLCKQGVDHGRRV